MEIILKGNWIEIELYNTELLTRSGERRKDMIGMNITSYLKFGGEDKITEVVLYPEDIENLKIALDGVLGDALKYRKEFHHNQVSEKMREEMTSLIHQEGEDLLSGFLQLMKELKYGYQKLFETGKWFDIPRDGFGIADTWSYSKVFEEFMPFLVWNSETGRPEFVDESWKDTGLHHNISWGQKYTKLKGII